MNVAWFQSELYSRTGNAQSGPPSTGRILSVSCPGTFNSRKFYAFLTFIKSGPSAIWADAKLQFSKAGQPAGELPASFADGTSINGLKSLPNSFDYSTTVPEANAHLLTLPFSIAGGVTQVHLMPVETSVDCDKIDFVINQFQDDNTTCTGFFAFVGCLSSL